MERRKNHRRDRSLILIFTVVCVILSSFTLSSCKPDSNTPDTPSDDEDPTVSPKTVIEGDARPVIVQTAYPTDDVVIADIVVTDEKYGADPTGQKDSTTAIQRALSECGTAGGGTVFLPTGTYIISRKVNIPSGVVLRGDWQNPDTAKKLTYGTVILAKLSPIKETSSASTGILFSLAANAGAEGLTVFYPGQDSENIKPFGFTFYGGLAGQGDTITLRHLTMINSYRGIGVSALYSSEWHELAEISDIHMCALGTGFDMAHSSDVGYSTDICIDTRYWTEASSLYRCTSPEKAIAYSREKAVGMILGDLDLEMLSGIAIRGCQTGIRFINPKVARDGAFWGTIYDLNITECDIGIDIEALNSRTGALISRGVVEGSVMAIRNGQVGIPLRLCGIEVRGKTEGVLQYDDNYITEKTGLSEYTVVHGQYEKPASYLIVADIAAMKGKKEDIGPAVQAALDEAGKSGGVVYLPAGVYSLYTPLQVPAGVQLSGVSPVMNRDTNFLNVGTVLLSYVKDQAAITLKTNAGVNGLRIWCPSYDPTTALDLLKKDDPLTEVPIISGSGKGVYCTNTALVSGFCGIDFLGCDEHYVYQIFGCCYRSLIKAGGKDGCVEECLSNPNFTQRHIDMFNYFDADYANMALWKTHHDGEQQAPSQSDYSAGFDLLCDQVLREYCTPYCIKSAQNQRLSNIFAYACHHLLSVTDADVLALNTAIDTLKGENAMFNVQSSRLTVVNAMRVFGTSVALDKNSTVHIYNRDDYNCITEHGYNSEVSFEDRGESPVKDITKTMTISTCDKIPTGMTQVKLTREDAEIMEGEGAWIHTYSEKNPVLAEWHLQEPIDISDYMENGYLHLWIYVDDIDALQGADGQIEFCSGGACDKEELGFSFLKKIRKSGWNELYLYIPQATFTGGTFRPEKVNYIRIYSTNTSSTNFIFDDIYICK